MRQPRSLEQLVRSGGFRARRHEHLLHGRDVPWSELRALQARFRVAIDEVEARKIALKFQSLQDLVRPSLTFRQILYSACGPGSPELDWFRQEDGSIDMAGYEELGRAFDTWNREYGLRFRAANGCLGQNDKLDIYWLVTGDTRKDLALVQPRFPELLAEFNRRAGRGKIPDPPGWEKFALGYQPDPALPMLGPRPARVRGKRKIDDVLRGM
jgi:hypothetical protein